MYISDVMVQVQTRSLLEDKKVGMEDELLNHDLCKEGFLHHPLF